MAEDLAGDFPDGAAFGGDEDVGLPVGGGSGLEESADFVLGVRILKERSVVLVADSLPDGVWGGPEADHEGVGFEAVQVWGVEDEAASGGDDAAFLGGQAGDHI